MSLLLSTTEGAQTLICSSSLAAHSFTSEMTPIAYNVSKLGCSRLIEHIANDHGKQGVQAYALPLARTPRLVAAIANPTFAVSHSTPAPC